MRRFFAVLVLLLAWGLGWSGLTVVRAVGALADPQVVAKVLPWPWLRDTMIIPRAQGQAADLAAHLPPQEPSQWVARALAQADEATWREMVDALLPPEKVPDLMADFWSPLWQALTRPGLETQKIPLTPWKEQLVQGIEPAMDVLLDALPPCYFQENLMLAQAALTQRWDEAPLCRPPRNVLDTFKPQMVAQGQEMVRRALPDALPLAQLFPADAVAMLRRVLVVTPLVGWGLVVLGGLLALLSAALAGRGAGGKLAWAGLAAMGYGLGIVLLARRGGEMVQSLLAQTVPFPPGARGMFAQAHLVTRYWQAMWASVLPWAWGLVGLGLILVGGGWALRSRPGR